MRGSTIGRFLCLLNPKKCANKAVIDGKTKKKNKSKIINT